MVTVYKVDKLTMEVVGKYDSQSQCARSEGVSRDTMRKRLETLAVPQGRFFYRYEKDYDKAESFERKENRPIAVTDICTGLSYGVQDAHWLADALKVPPRVIYSALRRKSMVLDRYDVKYLR